MVIFVERKCALYKGKYGNHNIFSNYHSLQKQHIDVEVPYEIPLRQLNCGNVTKLWLMLTLIYASLSFCEKDLHKRNIFAYEWSCLMKIRRRVMHSFETRRKLCRSKWWRISRIFETSLKLTRHPTKKILHLQRASVVFRRVCAFKR